MKKSWLTLLAGFALAGAAQANVISQDFNVTTGTFETGRLDFTVTTAGNFSMNALGNSTLGAGFDSDTMLHLFKNSLTLGNYLGGDDDSGIGSDALLNLVLAIGNYILIVGDFSFDANGAIAGIGGIVEAPGGTIRALVSSTDGVAQLTTNDVPEPGTLALFALAAAGLLAARRQQTTRG